MNATGEMNGYTALMLAANRGQLAVVEALLEAGAEASIRGRDGWTALAAARMIGDDEIARLLERAGARE